MGRDNSTFLQAGPAGGRSRWQGRRTLRRSRGGTREQRDTAQLQPAHILMSKNLSYEGMEHPTRVIQISVTKDRHLMWDDFRYNYLFPYYQMFGLIDVI